MRYLCSCDVQVLKASEFCCLCFQVLVVVCFHVCSLFLLSTLSLCFVLLSSQSLMSPSLFTVPSQCQAYVCFLVCITSCFILFNACLTYVQICFHCLITPIISCVPWCIPSHHLLPHVYLSPWFSSIGDPPPHITVCVLSSIWQCRFSVSLLQFKCLMCWHICLGQLIKLRMVHSAFHTTIPWQVFVISNAKQLKIVLHVHLSYVWILHPQA